MPPLHTHLHMCAANLHMCVLMYSSLCVHVGVLHVSVLVCTFDTCHAGSSEPLCSTVLLHRSVPVHTQHVCGCTLGTSLHMCVPVFIRTSCLLLCPLCFRCVCTLMCVGLHTCVPWHMPWPSPSPPQRMHGLCPPLRRCLGD